MGLGRGGGLFCNAGKAVPCAHAFMMELKVTVLGKTRSRCMRSKSSRASCHRPALLLTEIRLAYVITLRSQFVRICVVEMNSVGCFPSLRYTCVASCDIKCVRVDFPNFL